MHQILFLTLNISKYEHKSERNHFPKQFRSRSRSRSRSRENRTRSYTGSRSKSFWNYPFIYILMHKTIESDIIEM